MTSTDGTSPTFETSPVRLPVIKGDGWFDSEHKQFVLCVEYRLSAEEMVAALYGVVELGDIASDEDLCGSVAVTLSNEGLPALGVRAAAIGRDAVVDHEDLAGGADDRRTAGHVAGHGRPGGDFGAGGERIKAGRIREVMADRPAATPRSRQMSASGGLGDAGLSLHLAGAEIGQGE